jgi:hypothetical protein
MKDNGSRIVFKIEINASTVGYWKARHCVVVARLPPRTIVNGLGRLPQGDLFFTTSNVLRDERLYKMIIRQNK